MAVGSQEPLILPDMAEGDKMVVARQAGRFEYVIKRADGTIRQGLRSSTRVLQDTLQRVVDSAQDGYKMQDQDDSGFLLSSASGLLRSLGIGEEPSTPKLDTIFERQISEKTAEALLEKLPSNIPQDVRDAWERELRDAASEVKTRVSGQLEGEKFEQKDTRVYYVDWMRIMAIYLVVVFHTVQALDDYVGVFQGDGRAVPSDGYRPRDDVAPTKERIMVENFQTQCLMIGMPMFFQISGRAQALGRPSNNVIKIIVARVTRLFLPFLASYCLLIPVWLWMKWPPAPKWAQQNLWNFEYWYWVIGFSVQTGWLWFLLALFIVTILTAPFIVFAETKQMIDLLFVGISIVSTLYVLTQIGKLSWRFTIWSVVGSSFSTFLALIIPFPNRQGEDIDMKLLTWAASMSKRDCCMRFAQSVREAKDKWQQLFRWVALRLSTGVQMISSIVMVRNFKYSECPAGLDFMPAFMLFYGFYIQGYFSERWSQGSKDLFLLSPKIDILGPRGKMDENIMKIFRTFVRMYQICAAMFMLMSICVAAPAGRRERMLYPAYSASFQFDSEEGGINIGFGVGHVLGTWAWMTVLLGLGQAYLNHIVQPAIYKHASNSTMVVYVFHWMFLKFISVSFLMRYDLKGDSIKNVEPLFWKFFDFIVLFSGAVCGSLLIYYVFLISPKWLPLGKLFGL